MRTKQSNFTVDLLKAESDSLCKYISFILTLLKIKLAEYLSDPLITVLDFTRNAFANISVFRWGNVICKKPL